MALSGSVSTSSWSSSSGTTRYYTFSWTATQSVANNTSTVKWTLKSAGTYSYNVAQYSLKATAAAIYGTISKTSLYSSTTKVMQGSGATIASGSFTVTHNANGVGAFKISLAAAIYSSGSSYTGSKTFTLDTIARESTITSASNVTMSESGAKCAIKWTPKSTSFSYKLTFKCGSKSVSQTVTPKTTSAYTYTGYSFKLSDWAPYITTSYTGTCTVTLATYSGSTQIGSSSSKTFSLNIPTTVLPTLTGTLISGTYVNTEKTGEDAQKDIVTIDGKKYFLCNWSKPEFVPTVGEVYGAGIVSYSLTINGVTTTVPKPEEKNNGVVTSVVLTQVGEDLEYIFSITDSRGGIAYVSGTYNATEYTVPTISGFSIKRDYSYDEEEYHDYVYKIRILIDKVSWYSFGTALNESTGEYEYINPLNKLLINDTLTTQKCKDLNVKEFTDSSGKPYFSDPTESSESLQGASNIDYIPNDYINVYLPTSSFKFVLTIGDNFYEEDISFDLLDETPIIDLRNTGKGIAFGKMSSGDIFDVGMDANFDGTITAEGHSGAIGERKFVSFGTDVSLTANNYKDITTFSLEPGVYNVSATIAFNSDKTTTSVRNVASISGTSATFSVWCGEAGYGVSHINLATTLAPSETTTYYICAKSSVANVVTSAYYKWVRIV